MPIEVDHLGGARLRYYETIHARSPYEPRICSITRSSQASSETLGRFGMAVQESDDVPHGMRDVVTIEVYP
ncbi:antitermination regulator [Propionibacterium sp. HMSC075A12]|uniref:Antitermination regulator n=1 Tax=Cutibacterium acnes TaxID=1747 RepID=A0AA44ZEH7_CUTAC|nr:hypothetical protein HMPREF9619_00961 [Cutibacterium acnes HL082PA2]EGE69595.1 hypothetical protein HMPREF9341_01929 [Cutibacterium acnes HL103PA1]MCM4180663.1 hypothetical protein [Cutibacterium acnes P15]MCU7485253.1 hypothetical protein [Cutibacterium acnes 19B2]MCU7487563.1 hypothetical protein [Cutibacterium acnes 19B1]OFL46650.1 antitermination regulator [Propionibacterium sp. HMSC068C01]OFQ66381.1 antitermination regulator [Propionibacterium sp. HMSC075A12]PEN29484.1 antiterminatio